MVGALPSELFVGALNTYTLNPLTQTQVILTDEVMCRLNRSDTVK